MGIRTLDTTRKDWEEHLSKIVRLSGTGTRVKYWQGATDFDPMGKRNGVFSAVREYADRGSLNLYQRRVDGGYSYEFEVR